MKMLHSTIRFSETSLQIAVALMVLSLCACGNPGVEQPENKGSESTKYETMVEFGADIQQSANGKSPMRVHLGPDNTVNHTVTAIFWTTGDEVACWNAEEKLWAPYTLVSGANSTGARFQGKAVSEEDDEAGIGQPAMNISHAIFPLSAAVSKDNKLISPGEYIHSIYFRTQGVQKYQAPIDGNPTFETQCNVMTGTRNEANHNEVFFTSAGGALLLRIKGSALMENLYGLKLVSNKDEKLWGTFSANIGDNGVSTVEVVSDINGAGLSDYDCVVGDNTMVLDCSNNGSPMVLDKENFTNFYFVVPYGVFSQGFTIYMDTDGTGSDPATGRFNDGKITTSKDNTIIQSDIKVMPALELTENVTLTWDLDDLYSQGTVTEF